MHISSAAMSRYMFAAGVPTEVCARLEQAPGCAWGVVMVRPDRPERRALYRSDGSLQSTFAIDAQDGDIRAALDAVNLEMRDNGVVFAVEPERR